MKITIEQSPTVAETEVVIRCKTADDNVKNILSLLEPLAKARLSGVLDGQVYPLKAQDIYYIEVVDRKTFLYGKKEVFETHMNLSELEGRLAGADFVRANKSCILNFAKVKSLRPDFGGRLSATMQNGEAITISRQYAPAVRQKLGMH